MMWHFGTSHLLLFLILLNVPGYKVKSNEPSKSQRERERDGVRAAPDWACSSVVWRSYLVLKYALMVAGDPFITSRKQKGVSLLI